MSGLKIYAVLVFVVLLLDLLWLAVLMKDFYAQQLGDLARRRASALSPRLWPAAGVYVLIPMGLILFVRPLIYEGTLWKAAGMGAIFGLVLYGVYDLTNRAVLEKWSLLVTCVDMAWGCVLCATSTVTMRMLDGWFR